jgi:hypothetical protein
MVLVPAVTAAVAAPLLTLRSARHGRKQGATSTLKLLFAAMPAAARKELPCPTTRKDLPCPTRL